MGHQLASPAHKRSPGQVKAAAAAAVAPIPRKNSEHHFLGSPKEEKKHQEVRDLEAFIKKASEDAVSRIEAQNFRYGGAGRKSPPGGAHRGSPR